jgi:predicted oxidoreductase
MQNLSLGGSTLEVSRLAYGCWRLPPGDHAAGRRAVYAAVEAGFTLFDHADIYGGGAGEEIFGEVMAETPRLRERLIIASKCGIRLPGESGPYRYDSRREHIVESCHASLRRMRVEMIDVFQIHRPDFLTHPQEIAAAFAELLAAGKVREFGVSNFRPSQVEALQSVCPMKLLVNQIECSLLQRAAYADGTLDQCLTETITPLAWSPLAGGQLADGAGDLLPSQRGYVPARVLPLLDEIAPRYGATRSQIALAWLLRHPAKIIPIVGSTDAARIASAAASADFELSREDWYQLLAAAEPGGLA